MMSEPTVRHILVGPEEFVLTPLHQEDNLHRGDVVATTVRPDTTRHLRGHTILYVGVLEGYDTDQEGWRGYRKKSISDTEGSYSTFLTDDYTESFVLRSAFFSLDGLGISVWKVIKVIRFS